VAVLGGLLLSNFLKIVFDRHRPDLVPNAPVELSASFPSGHAMLSAVTYLTLGALLTRVEADRRAASFFPV
ncbi:phosphatase PAP2 family protein, partial [Escherichia coli]|uniref:phosphatase PAP2 family protein n=1 Tax=Escherichia coli TaxID=562 RepID=UPI0013D3D10B